MGLSVTVDSLVAKVKEAADLRKLKSVLFMKLVFKPYGAVGYVHIAGERGDSYIPIFRIGNQIYIPPSSVYGALRSIAESIAKASVETGSVDDVDKLFIALHCEPEGDIIRHNCVAGIDIDIATIFKDLVKRLREDRNMRAIARHFYTDEALEELWTTINAVKSASELPRGLETLTAILCPICRLFGGPGIEAKLKILRVVPKAESIYITTHTAIDRYKGTVVEGALYTIESTALTELQIEILVKNITPHSTEAKLLENLIEYLTTIGISLGGKKSIGLGKLLLNKENSKAIYRDIDTINKPEELINTLIDIENQAAEPIDTVIKNLSKQTQLS